MVKFSLGCMGAGGEGSGGGIVNLRSIFVPFGNLGLDVWARGYCSILLGGCCFLFRVLEFGVFGELFLLQFLQGLKIIVLVA